jgi:cytochrome c5
MRLGYAAVAAALLAWTTASTFAQEKAASAKMSLAQARQTVTMLNDLYVTSVVVTHGTYVKDRASVPAAVVARKVFDAMKEKGWPQTRWLSTTGRPFNPDANPKDQFERDAVAALKKGEARFERIEANRLRVATLIPLVDKSCQTCHTRDEVGKPVGGLSYTVEFAP